MAQFTSKVALVTGGSSGMGREPVLARRGLRSEAKASYH